LKHERSGRLAAALLVAALVGACGDKSGADKKAGADPAAAQAAEIIKLKGELQQSPGNAETRLRLGTLLLLRGEVGAAYVELGKAKELGLADEKVVPQLVRAMLALGKFKEVVQGYQGVTLPSAGAEAELRTAVAVAFASLNKLPEAEKEIGQAIQSDPKNAWALLTKCRLAAAGGRFDEALALVDQAIALGGAVGEAQLVKATLLRMVKKDLPGSIALLQQATLDPGSVVDARTGVIQIHMSQGKLADAKKEFAELAKTHPKHPMTLYIDAMLSYADKDYQRTELITDQLIGLNPTSTQLLVLGGAASMNRGALVAAETKLGKAQQLASNNSLAKKLLADTYLRMGQPDKALGTLRPLIEQSRPDTNALALAGQAHLQAGNVQEAEALFKAVAKVKPDDVQMKTALALTYLVNGNSATAFETLQQIAATDPGETADLALISALMQRKDFAGALSAIERLEKKLPNKASTHQLRGQALRGSGDLAAARAAFEASLKIDPGYFASTAALLTLDAAEGKRSQALERANAAVKSSPGNMAARMAVVSLMQQQQAKPESILAAIDEAMKAGPADAAPHLAKIAHLARMNDTRGAALAAQNAMAVLPQNADVLDAAGRALDASGDSQQAISTFNKMASVVPRSPQPYLRLADLFSRKGEAAAVASNLNRAFEVAPEAPDVHRRLLANAAKTKDFKPVAAAAKELQRRFPQSAVGYLLEGDAASLRKDAASAVAAYKTATTKPDASGRPQRLIYTTLRKAGDAAGADRFAAEWMKANPKDGSIREFLGGDAIVRKDLARAEALFGELLAIEPKSGVAMNNLAWLMSLRGAKGAVEMAQRALALAPGSAPVLDTLASALAAEGQFDKAVEVQKQALAAMPERQNYRFNLAKIYAKAGRQADALAELDALAKLGDKLGFQPEVAALRRQLQK
jgi:cellulose synthase operon protein C